MRQPEFGAELPPAHKSAEALELLALRRSTPADHLSGPGPDNAQLDLMLRIAARVPDHRRVTPFRFILFEDEARAAFGKILRAQYVANEPDVTETRAECEQNRFMRAPVVVAIVSSVNPEHRTPEWEQILTAGAVCQNLLLAANASGFAAQWLTEWYAFDAAVLKALGLSENERVAGYVYIGTAKEHPKERARPDMDAIVSRYEGNVVAE